MRKRRSGQDRPIANIQSPIRDGYILLGDGPGHGMTLNEDVARAHLKPGTSFFGDEP